MTHEEFLLLVKGMKAVYTYDNFLADGYSIEMWYALLKDLPYNLAAASLKSFMQTSNKVPTPADIRNGVASLSQPEELNEMQAWSMVSKAIGRSGYHSQEEYDKLPEVIQRAVGTPRQLFVWSQTEDGVETVVQSQFIRSYRRELERKQYRQSLSPDILSLIETTAKRLEG